MVQPELWTEVVELLRGNAPAHVISKAGRLSLAGILMASTNIPFEGYRHHIASDHIIVNN